MSTSSAEPARSPPAPRPASSAGTAASASQGSSPGTACSAEEQASAAQEVIRRIRELDLRTVRFVVADQHGSPRSRSLSAQAATDVFANGLDFSGAIYSLDTGNNVFVPPFAARRRVRHRGVHRLPRRGPGARPGHLPGAAVGGPHRLDPVRRLLRQRPAGAAGRPRPDAPHAGRARRGRLRLPGRPRGRVLHRQAGRAAADAGERRVHPGPAAGQRVRAGLPVPLRGAAGQRGRHAGGAARRPDRGRAAAPLDGGRVGPGPDGVHLLPDGRAGRRRRGRAVPVRGQADLPAARAAGHVHVHARPAELLLLRLAPAPVADPAPRRAERVRQPRRAAVGRWAAVRLRAARPRAADDAVRRADGERLPALPPVLVRPRPGVLGGGEPRRAWSGCRARRATPAATWRTGSASPPPTRTCTWRPTSPPGWTASGAAWTSRRWRRTRTPPQARHAADVTGRGGRRPGQGRLLPAGVRQDSRRLSADDEAGRAETVYRTAMAENPPAEDQPVTDWEMREYFEFF